MDAVDLEIIDLLQRDARKTQQEIARHVKLSQPSVAERIRKLEERGVITGYAARVSPHKLGMDITAFIGVGIDHPKHFEEFAKRMLELPDVLEAHRVAGEYSYLLKVRTANTRSLDKLLVQTLRAIPGVVRTNTIIVLSSLKEETRIRAALDDEDEP